MLDSGQGVTKNRQGDNQLMLMILPLLLVVGSVTLLQG
jgi:hypothetical protein